MKHLPVILLLLAFLAGCRGTGVAGYWEKNGTDYSDADAAETRLAVFAEMAVAAPENEAISEMDVLFDMMLKDEVAYYLYLDWLDLAFYSPLSPCRNLTMYGKIIERIISDGVLSDSECAPYLRRFEWMQINRKGTQATAPGFIPNGRRTLVVVLDRGCPGCRESLRRLSIAPEWSDVRRFAVCCGYGPEPDVPGWEYSFPKDVANIFDQDTLPVYFTVSGKGLVETSYKSLPQ